MEAWLDEGQEDTSEEDATNRSHECCPSLKTVVFSIVLSDVYVDDTISELNLRHLLRSVVFLQDQKESWKNGDLITIII